MIDALIKIILCVMDPELVQDHRCWEVSGEAWRRCNRSGGALSELDERDVRMPVILFWLTDTFFSLLPVGFGKHDTIA